MIDPAELDPRARRAAGRYRLEPIDASGDAFAAAWELLDGEFGSKGELERREVLLGWLRRGPAMLGDLHHTYHLLVARDGADAGAPIAAVRDCHVTVDRDAGVCVVYLAHLLVLPAYRRTGLGALLREAPRMLGRRAMGAAGELLLVAEMEPPRGDDRASLVRLLAYGREGFAALDPAALPYVQPDFRAPAAIGAHPSPVPLCCVVRREGHAGAISLPKQLARRCVAHLYAVFSTHCRADHLEAAGRPIVAALDAWPGAEVPLAALPASAGDEALLRTLGAPR